MTRTDGSVSSDASADPVVEVLDEGSMELPERNGYHKDARGQWMRRVGSTRSWEKYCNTCNVWRPPRASHCNICGYCMVRRFMCGVPSSCASDFRCFGAKAGSLHGAADCRSVASRNNGWQCKRSRTLKGCETWLCPLQLCCALDAAAGSCQEEKQSESTLN